MSKKLPKRMYRLPESNLQHNGTINECLYLQINVFKAGWTPESSINISGIHWLVDDTGRWSSYRWSSWNYLRMFELGNIKNCISRLHDSVVNLGRGTKIFNLMLIGWRNQPIRERARSINLKLLLRGLMAHIYSTSLNIGESRIRPSHLVIGLRTFEWPT